MALGKLNEHPLTPHIPVFVLTGQDQLADNFLFLGAATIFAKPLEFEQLAEELGKFIPLPKLAC